MHSLEYYGLAVCWVIHPSGVDEFYIPPKLYPIEGTDPRPAGFVKWLCLVDKNGKDVDKDLAELLVGKEMGKLW